MVSHRIRIARMLVVALLFGVALALVALPSVALAVPDEIRGCDHVFAGQEPSADGAMDILAVSGDDGETVYLEIRKADGGVIASHLCYVLHDDGGATDADGKVVGVVSVTPATGVSLDGAMVRVYGDRAQTQLAWEGTVSTAYARLGHDGEATEIPLALRTLGAGEERPFAAPGTLSHGGAVYALASDVPSIEGGRAYYAYEASDETPAAVDGHISYYDAKDPAEPIKVDDVRDIRRDTSREVAIPDAISVDGQAYRTIQLTDKVTLSYPGATEYSVQCLRLESASLGDPGTFYKARISYVDEQGRSLGVTDSVIVDRRYLYTPPTRLHVRGDDGRFVTYVLSAGNDLSEGGAIVLEPGQAEGTRDVSVTYGRLPDDAERTWTVVLVNGSVSPGDPAREIGRVTYRGVPGRSVTHRTDASIEANGATLVPASFSEASYTHTFDASESQTEQVIYYVPDGWAAPDAYEIKVNYVNIATNGVISSEGYTATPTMRRDLEISTPQTFDQGGTRYIRLNGQGLAIRHSFYSPTRTYNVYYRESGDDLHTKTIIRSVRVEYVDPETGDTVYRPTTLRPQTDMTDGATGVPAGSAGTGTGNDADGRRAPQRTGTPAGAGTDSVTGAGTGTQTPAPATTTPAAAGTETGIGTESEVMSIIDDDTPLGLVTDEGTDLATVRIEDNETPMAAGPGGRAGDESSPVPLGVAIGVGAVVTAIAAALVAFLVARRRGRGGNSNSTWQRTT